MRPTRRIATVLSTAVLLLSSWACSKPDPVNDAGFADAGEPPDAAQAPDASQPLDAAQEPGPDAGPAADVSSIAWGPCSGGFSGACGRLAVPLDYDQPEGRALDLYVDQIASSARSRAQLWLLQGGPGGTGADLVPMGLELASRLPDVDIYTLDHRGVNRSAALECEVSPTLPDGGLGSPGEQYAQAWEGCLAALEAEWGAGLQQFTISNAARDLARAIDALRRPGQDVYVYGVSYGTSWAQRYLQLFPDQATAVVLDSVVAPDAQFLSDWDRTTNLGIAHWLQACQADATCSAKLGDDPGARLQDIANQLRGGHCPAIGPGLPTAVASLFMSTLLGPYALAAMYRAERCDAQDVLAVNQLVQNAAALISLQGFSEVLYDNVAFSEIWETPAPSYEELLARADVLFPTGVELQGTLGQRWPVYPLDQYAHVYPTAAVPVLALNGTLDVQTPIDVAQLAAAHYQGAHQYFVTVPMANHGVVTQSQTAGGVACGERLLVAFLEDPEAQLDTSCAQQVVPPDFAGSAVYSQYLMGVSEMWENADARSLVPARPPDAELARELERVRRARRL